MTKQKLGNIISGLSLIIIGTVIFLENLNIIDLQVGMFSWPIFIFIPALGFHAGFFLSGMRKNMAGLLVPGGILMTLSLLFYFEVMTDFQYAEYTWPIYILAPAVGLFELWLFSGREKGLLIPIGILTVIAGLFLAQMLFAAIFKFWPIIFIVIGLYILFGRNKKQKNDVPIE
ncbi:hypothetical protein [Pontibacillus sp. HMF3514]|uniref:hypothetical protein n=1 Tax=Pontibacillus sp. HMF3514 TaxID=2692425 RepID=UPI0013203010|nr:hypothetical protein [Pontibacillus sp. HMF3514]QHE51836.1 hypothetical protein GS400_07225 [Pontibacillus sp. HMF3514]